MGMFTTILDPAQDLSVQIKCGWDECAVFSVGETVPWRIIADWPNQGYLLDDVYLGIGGTPKQDEDSSWDDYWVVIKNHIVQEVFVYQDSDDYQELRKHFRIQYPPEDLWAQDVWKAYREEIARAKKETEEFNASIAHLPQVERIARTLHRLRPRVNYQEMAKRIFIVEPLPPKPLLCYIDLETQED